MVKREKIVITIFAAVIVLAIGLNLSSWPQKIPHVTIYSSYDIRNVESLFSFERESIHNIKCDNLGQSHLSHEARWVGDPRSNSK